LRPSGWRLGRFALVSKSRGRLQIRAALAVVQPYQ
jgi:hypothetical protein